MHGPGQLLGHLQLPQNIDSVLVLLQVGVQRAKLHILLHHDVWEQWKHTPSLSGHTPPVSGLLKNNKNMNLSGGEPRHLGTQIVALVPRGGTQKQREDETGAFFLHVKNELLSVRLLSELLSV